MPNNSTSPEFSTINVPDVFETFQTILAKQPIFSSIVPVSARRATNHKHEWLEHKKVQISWMVDGVSAIGSTALTLDSTTGVKAGDVLEFEKPTGASTSVKAKVDSVDNATDLTITRLFTTDEDILDNSVVYLVSRAKGEKSGEDLDDNAIPVRKFNYTQIFRRDFCLSRTLLQTEVYGLATEAAQTDKTMSLVEFEVENQLQDIAFELNRSMISGVQEERVDGGANGAMGGILEYMEADPASVLDAAAAPVSLSILNAAIEQAVQNGANGPSLTVMLCNSNQGSKISQLNVAGNNPVVQQASTQLGSFVQVFKSDLAGTNGGALTMIVVDRNFPKDKIAIFNPENNALVAMENFGVTETTDNKVDGRTWKILGEMTAEWRNANDEAIVITNLDV